MATHRQQAGPSAPASHDPHVSRRLFLKGSGATIAAAGATAPAAVPGGAQDASPVATPAGPSTETEPLSPPAIEFFSAYEAAMVEALTARILPGTPDDPGAREAGVVYYIDRVLAGPDGGYAVKTYRQGPYLVVHEEEATVESTSRTDIYQVVEIPAGDDISRYGYQSVLTPQDIYRRGLASVDVHAQATFNGVFLDLSDDQQDSVLEAMEADEATGFDAPSGSAFFTKLRNDTIEGVFSDPIHGGNRDMVGWRLIGYPGARGFYTAADMANGAFSAEPVSLQDAEGHSH
jgi:hypothetical protein